MMAGRGTGRRLASSKIEEWTSKDDANVSKITQTLKNNGFQTSFFGGSSSEEIISAKIGSKNFTVTYYRGTKDVQIQGSDKYSEDYILISRLNTWAKEQKAKYGEPKKNTQKTEAQKASASKAASAQKTVASKAAAAQKTVATKASVTKNVSPKPVEKNSSTGMSSELKSHVDRILSEMKKIPDLKITSQRFVESKDSAKSYYEIKSKYVPTGISETEKIFSNGKVVNSEGYERSVRDLIFELMDF